MWGFPKFQADVGFEVEAGVVHASVIKDGTPLLDATMQIGEPDPPSELPPVTLLLLK